MTAALLLSLSSLENGRITVARHGIAGIAGSAMDFFLGEIFFGANICYMDMIYGEFVVISMVHNYLWMSLGLPIQLWCMADFT